jgi:hypothetical protein
MGAMHARSPPEKVLTSLTVRQFRLIFGRGMVVGLGTGKCTKLGVVTKRTFGQQRQQVIGKNF